MGASRVLAAGASPPPYDIAVGFASRRTHGANSHPLFLWKRRRKEKAIKKKRRNELSPSAECDKGPVPLTAPPLQRWTKTFGCFAELPPGRKQSKNTRRKGACFFFISNYYRQNHRFAFCLRINISAEIILHSVLDRIIVPMIFIKAIAHCFFCYFAEI